jgi:rare lipoprotein A
MKTVTSTLLSGLTRRIGVGMTALALAVTFGLPTAALAKSKKTSHKVSKVSVEKKVSKKLSKKSSKPQTVAKHTKSTAKIAAKSTAKVTKKTVTSKHSKAAHAVVAHKAVTHKHVAEHKVSAHKVASHKSTAHKKVAQHRSHASKHAQQAYYVMPDSLAGDVGKPQQQPTYLKPPADTPPTAKAGKAHQVGTASYYSDSFDGGKTASGERFDQDRLTCAHGSLPFGCRIRVTNLRNNKAVEVKVNDRGGFGKHGRMIDLSKAAATEIGMMGTGTAKVKVEVLK